MQSFIVSLRSIPKGGDTQQVRRLTSLEVHATDIASAKKEARTRLIKKGYNVRSIAYGARGDLVAYVWA